MNFSTMSYFVAVAEEQSFTRAAERLSITQQTLSAHVAATERELGVRLVNRRVPLTLTYAGREFLEYAREFQARERAMRQEFQDISGDERGLLGVGIASTRGHMLMPQALSDFQREHPGIDVHLREAENSSLIELLREGSIDLAVATIPPDSPGLVVRHLCDERVVLLVSRDLLGSLYGKDAGKIALDLRHTGSLSRLSGCPFLMLGKGDEPGDLSRRLLARDGVRPWVRVSSTNSETLVGLASRSAGACFVPSDLADLAMREYPQAGLEAFDLGGEARISISVAWRASEHVWSVVEGFSELLGRQVRERDERRR
ncbi:LysR family transcriptional regulator [Olsenella urininfantis]|uniref:LysR family transcriptional regulator n=1 Tax=Olsenella urininfantis TaxID=1871033 RepID=UPI00190ED0A6|nr:LysR family transcriptional regulator [Olsenella urininfantis]